MINFRCGRCTERVQASESEAGRAIPCPRCQHVNICPEPSSTLTPAVHEPIMAPRSPLALNAVWAVVATVAVAGCAWGVWSAFSAPAANAAPTARVAATVTNPAEALQQQLLKKNAGQPGDPMLGRLLQDINSKYFAGSLPAIPVMWEPGLVEVGKLAQDAFTLEGMFGHSGKHSLILLNPHLQHDEAALMRALCHEVVHFYLFTMGNTSSGHDAEFQGVLKRLSVQGAFEGILATDEERTNLRAWLDAESSRLDTERDQLTKIGAEIEQERLEIERILADIGARASDPNAAGGRPSDAEIAMANTKRDAYNSKAIDANARSERSRADLEKFNREVARYNLMLVYPDGMDTKAMVKAKPGR